MKNRVIKADKWNELCDLLLNGLLTLKHHIKQLNETTVAMAHRSEQMDIALRNLRENGNSCYNGIDQELKELIKRQEGQRLLQNGNHKLYRCPAGRWTIGWGRNVEANGVSDEEAEFMLENDLVRCQEELARTIPGARDFGENGYYALVSMMYNLGARRFMTFKNMIRAAMERDRDGVVREMMDSKWARDPATKARACELAEMFKRR